MYFTKQKRGVCISRQFTTPQADPQPHTKPPTHITTGRTRQQAARQKQVPDNDVTVLVLASLRRSQAPVLRGLMVSWRAGRGGVAQSDARRQQGGVAARARMRQRRLSTAGWPTARVAAGRGAAGVPCARRARSARFRAARAQTRGTCTLYGGTGARGRVMISHSVNDAIVR